jgi:hypothetical protein
MSSEEKIRIVTYGYEEPMVRRFVPEVSRSISDIPSETVRKNMEKLLSMLSDIFSNTPKDIGGFSLSELEVHADIDLEGKIGLLGTGLAVGSRVGLVIKLKRE